MSDRYGVIDPAQLPTMTVLQESDAEALLRRRMLSLKARWSEADPPYGAVYDVEGLEFDPLKVTQEVGTNYQITLEARVNQSARDVTLAGAYGSNLDGIATRYPGGCPRLPIVSNPRPYAQAPQDWEADARYRKRIWLSPNAFTTAGAREAYEFWALTAAPTLRDATARAIRTLDGPVVLVTCLGGAASGEPTKDELVNVRLMFDRTDIRPLTDIVSVQPPAFTDVSYDATVWLYPGPDTAVVQKILEERLTAYLESLRFLGKDHTDDGYAATLRIEGVTHSQARHSPAKDVRVDDGGFVRVIGTPKINIPRDRRT